MNIQNLLNPKTVSAPPQTLSSQLTESTAPPNTLSALPPRQQQHQLLQPLDTLAIDRQLFPAFPHSPVKTYNAWEQNEDDLLITLRGSGMKWEDIANMMPGRTAIACRLHYQNYLEHPLSWNTEIKDKLAKLYVRFKPNMWTPLALELGVPWRAAERMHWQLGEEEMVRRAEVMASTLASSSATYPANAFGFSSASGMEYSRSGDTTLDPNPHHSEVRNSAGRASKKRKSGKPKGVSTRGTHVSGKDSSPRLRSKK